MEVEKDNYESMTLIIHAVLSVSHYKNTKCFGMSAVTDRILMTWLFFFFNCVPLFLRSWVLNSIRCYKKQTQSLFSMAAGKVKLLSGV